jgi:protein pelota
MRLIKQSIEQKDGSGSATLLPEEPEDMVSKSVYT